MLASQAEPDRGCELAQSKLVIDIKGARAPPHVALQLLQETNDLEMQPRDGPTGKPTLAMKARLKIRRTDLPGTPTRSRSDCSTGVHPKLRALLILLLVLPAVAMLLTVL